MADRLRSGISNPMTEALSGMAGWLGRNFTMPQGGSAGPYTHQMTPSRGTVRDMATAENPNPRDVQNRLAEEAAKNAAARVAAGDQMTKEYDTEPPTDPMQEKVGTGPLAVRPTGPRGEEIPSSYENYSVVRMPDGRVISTGDGGEGLVSRGGSLDPPGSKANVAAGPAGAVFSSSENALIGPGGADLAGVNLPTDEDRSPGWATRKAYNDLYSAGDLSMNPRDIMDRRRWEESEEARESDLELARARRDFALRQAAIDPYEMARIEAEGKYAGKAIEAENENSRIMAAAGQYAAIGERIGALEQQLATIDPEAAPGQAAALQDALGRLEQERREWANMLMGFQLRDPDINPFAAMFGAGMAPGATPGGER